MNVTSPTKDSVDLADPTKFFAVRIVVYFLCYLRKSKRAEFMNFHSSSLINE